MCARVRPLSHCSRPRHLVAQGGRAVQSVLPACSLCCSAAPPSDQVMQKQSGIKGIDAFAQRWVYGRGCPEFELGVVYRKNNT